MALLLGKKYARCTTIQIWTQAQAHTHRDVDAPTSTCRDSETDEQAHVTTQTEVEKQTGPRTVHGITRESVHTIL